MMMIKPTKHCQYISQIKLVLLVICIGSMEFWSQHTKSQCKIKNKLHNFANMMS